MKIYLCVAGILSALVLVECQLPAEVERQRIACAKELGLPAKDPKGKCFHACVMIKKGIMVNGKASAEKVTEWMEKHAGAKLSDAMEGTFVKCTKKANAENDECEVAGIFEKCIAESASMPKLR